MKTIAENLQILKDSADAIKLAIIDNGGKITGGLSSYAEAINNLFPNTFTICGISYNFREGMTWGEWVNSEYNIDGFTVVTSDSYSSIYLPKDKFSSYMTRPSYAPTVAYEAGYGMYGRGNTANVKETILEQEYYIYEEK